MVFLVLFMASFQTKFFLKKKGTPLSGETDYYMKVLHELVQSKLLIVKRNKEATNPSN